MIDNKRGQGLSTNAIILIILGVVVLVVLIAGFTMGWGSLKEFLGGSSNNVDTIARACATACATDSVYDFCSVKRDLKDARGDSVKDITCKELSFLDQYDKYGIGDCTSIDCPVIEIVKEGDTTRLAKQCSDSGKEWSTTTKPEGKNCMQYSYSRKDNYYCCEV